MPRTPAPVTADCPPAGRDLGAGGVPSDLGPADADGAWKRPGRTRSGPRPLSALNAETQVSRRAAPAPPRKSRLKPGGDAGAGWAGAGRVEEQKATLGRSPLVASPERQARARRMGAKQLDPGVSGLGTLSAPHTQRGVNAADSIYPIDRILPARRPDAGAPYRTGFFFEWRI